ncbi:glycosyltransferase family 4 protein [Candidatus Woesearchaeota archaeon]|nr:glycosyltransferase family 4 protein [Candidatus Woesearchaeota archaeon]
MFSRFPLQHSNSLNHAAGNNPLHVAIVTPSYPPTISGNATTVSRIVEGLQKKHVSCHVFLPSTFAQISSNKLRTLQVSLIHAFHGYKSGIIAQEIATQLNIPLVLTLTGTDINVDLHQPSKQKKLCRVFNKTQVITVFHKRMQKTLLAYYPQLHHKIVIIHQSVKLIKQPYALREKLTIPKKSFLFYLSAGLRRLKYHAFYLPAFIRLHKLNKQRDIHLVVVGSVLEPDFAQSFLETIKPYSWIHYIPSIPHENIAAALQEVDIVLNTSESEGQSNNILEAMSLGKPVLAAAISGNKALICDQKNGLLFSSPTNFFKKASLLIDNATLRRELGQEAKTILGKHAYTREISAYFQAYQRALYPVR